MDPIALRIANALVGNPDDAAALEITLRGPRLQVQRDCVLALAGADLDARSGGEPLPNWRPLLVRGGSEIDTGIARAGARAYLAVRGGFDIVPVLASRSTDVNAHLGPLGGRVLAGGDELPIGTSGRDDFERMLGKLPPNSARRGAKGSIVAARWSVDPSPWFEPDPAVPVCVQRGRHFGQLDEHSQTALFDSEFRIGVQSNRVGYRLEGPALALRTPLELISEGVVPGTVQLPPGGQAIVLMAEAPTTGGYPRIAQVAEVDRSRLAQRKPGDRLRFVEISLAEAQSRYLERERALRALFQTIHEHLRH